MPGIATQSWQEKLPNGMVAKICRILFCGGGIVYEHIPPLDEDRFFTETSRKNDIVACCISSSEWIEMAKKNLCLIVDDCDCVHVECRDIDNIVVFGSIREAIHEISKR